MYEARPVTTRVYAVVAIVADDRGRFLVVSRKDDHEDLGFPGGRIEGNETPDEAVVRELREEAGLVVSRRAVRSTLVAADPKGRLCMAFDVLRHKGVPYSTDGAWVGWVQPSRLTDPRNTFHEYNVAVFAHKGIALDTPALVEDPPLVSAPTIERPRRVRVSTRPPARPHQVGYTLEDALMELTGQQSFPQRHITFLHGEAALSLCPAVSIQQPRLSFDQKEFAAILSEPVLGIRTHLQRSLVPLNLFRYIHSLGPRCLAAIVAVSPHRPPEDWESVSSLIIECLHTNIGVKLRLVKSLGGSAQLIGTSVVFSRLGTETTADHRS